MEQNRKKSKNIVIVIGLASLLMASIATFWFVADSKRGAAVSKAMRQEQESSQTEYQANPVGGNFTLHSADGDVSLSDFRGKLVLIFFGYTTCTTACPATMNEIANVLSLLTPEELEQVQPIFVSFDQERDTLASIKEYAGYFNEKIIGLGGSNEEVSAVAKQYGSIYQKDYMIESDLGYGFSHTSTTYLVDQNGVSVDAFPFDIGPEIIAEELKYRIANPPDAVAEPISPQEAPATKTSEEPPSFDAFAPSGKE